MPKKSPAVKEYATTTFQLPSAKLPYVLGQRLKDKVTGLTGIATAVTLHINGCAHYRVVSEVSKEGKIFVEDLDPQFLELIDEGVAELVEDTVDLTEETGGPAPY
jgi:hypothetical protein